MLVGLLLRFRRGKTFLLTFVMNMMGNLRFPVERIATTAMVSAELVSVLRLSCRVSYLTNVGSPLVVMAMPGLMGRVSLVGRFILLGVVLSVLVLCSRVRSLSALVMLLRALLNLRVMLRNLWTPLTWLLVLMARLVLRVETSLVLLTTDLMMCVSLLFPVCVCLTMSANRLRVPWIPVASRFLLVMYVRYVVRKGTLRASVQSRTPAMSAELTLWCGAPIMCRVSMLLDGPMMSPRQVTMLWTLVWLKKCALFITPQGMLVCSSTLLRTWSRVPAWQKMVTLLQSAFVLRTPLTRVLT